MMMAMTDGFVYQRLADPDRLPASLLAEGINVFLNGVLTGAGVGPVQRDA
jgi:hypothetical protein